eukprot:2607317-Prymnesium_polylepis.1
MRVWDGWRRESRDARPRPRADCTTHFLLCLNSQTFAEDKALAQEVRDAQTAGVRIALFTSE